MCANACPVHMLNTYLTHVRSRMILESSLMTSSFFPRDRARDRARGTTQQHATDRSRMHARVTHLLLEG